MFLKFLTFTFSYFFFCDFFNCYSILIPGHPVTVYYWYTLSSIIFLFGFFGLLLSHQNFLTFLIKIEVMYLGLNLFLISHAYFYTTPLSFVYAILLLGYVAAESALGLSLFFYQYLIDKELARLNIWY